MSKLQKVLFYFIIIVGTLLILVTLLSLLYNTKLWFLKALDFPRIQTFIGLLICTIAFLIINKVWKPSSIALAIGLIASIILQSIYLLPYTPLKGKAVPDTVNNSETSFSIMLANVWMKNDKSEELVEIIKSSNPDIV
jgi:hypothetical protein